MVKPSVCKLDFVETYPINTIDRDSSECQEEGLWYEREMVEVETESHWGRTIPLLVHQKSTQLSLALTITVHISYSALYPRQQPWFKKVIIHSDNPLFE